MGKSSMKVSLENLAKSISPIAAGEVAASLAAFVFVYTIIFGAGIYYIVKLVRKGPTRSKKSDHYYDHGLEANVTHKLKKS